MSFRASKNVTQADLDEAGDTLAIFDGMFQAFLQKQPQVRQMLKKSPDTYAVAIGFAMFAIQRLTESTPDQLALEAFKPAGSVMQ